MTHFEFTGDWEYTIALPAFSGFQSRNGAYTSIDSSLPSTGEIKLIIEDDLSDNADPYPEQLETIQFIIENQNSIIDSILERTIKEIPEIIRIYDLENDDKYSNITVESIKRLIGISSIRVLLTSKDNFAYYDIVGGCNWDEEHGLNILMHRDRAITFGTIDGNSYWDALKDNGTYEDVSNGKSEKLTPIKYLPNPKYNELKPSQKFANETFEHSLISGGFNNIFIDLTNKGEIDINGKWESQDKTFLETACWFKNNEIVEFLLSKGAKIRYSLHQCVVYNDNPEALALILKYGGDINQQNQSGDTILNLKCQSLSSLYDHKMQSIKYKWNREQELDIKIGNEKKVIADLIKKGSNPNLKNIYGFDAFAMARNLSDEYKKEMISYISDCITNNRNHSQWWKFWKK